MKTLKDKINELLDSKVLEILCGARSYSDTMHDNINQHNRNFGEWLNHQEMYKDTRHTVESCENKKWYGLKYEMSNGYGHEVKRFVFPMKMMDYNVSSDKHAINLFFKYLKPIK